MTDREKYERLKMALESIKTVTWRADQAHQIAEKALKGIEND